MATGVEGVEQASESSTALLKSSSSSKAVKGRLKTYFNRLIYTIMQMRYTVKLPKVTLT